MKALCAGIDNNMVGWFEKGWPQGLIPLWSLLGPTRARDQFNLWGILYGRKVSSRISVEPYPGLGRVSSKERVVWGPKEAARTTWKPSSGSGKITLGRYSPRLSQLGLAFLLVEKSHRGLPRERLLPEAAGVGRLKGGAAEGTRTEIHSRFEPQGEVWDRLRLMVQGSAKLPELARSGGELGIAHHKCGRQDPN